MTRAAYINLSDLDLSLKSKIGTEHFNSVAALSCLYENENEKFLLDFKINVLCDIRFLMHETNCSDFTRSLQTSIKPLGTIKKEFKSP